MPKKRKNPSKRKGKKDLVIGIVLVVIAAAIIFIALNYKGAEEKDTIKQGNKISIYPESFIFMTSFYLNEKDYDRSHCSEEISCQTINEIPIQCPNVDQLTMRFRVQNLNSVALISCTVTNGENKYTQQHFAFYPIGKLAELSLQNIAYNEKHNFEICCQYDDGKIKSNEFCLPPVTVKSICS